MCKGSLLTLGLVTVEDQLVDMLLVARYGGWGPGEDYGHTGHQPPTHNHNARFGFDQLGILQDKFNYRQDQFNIIIPLYLENF